MERTTYRNLARLLAILLVIAAPLGVQAQNSPDEEEATAFAQAQQAERAGDFQTAERIYLEVLRKHHDEMAAELNLGLAYYMDHRYAESSERLLKALHANPALFPALMVAGVDYLKLGEPQRAIPLLRRARALRPTDEYVNHNLASAEYLAGDYPAACGDYVKYLRLPGRAKDVPAWYGLGEASILLSRQASARLGAQSAANPYRLRLLAVIYRDQKEWTLAISRLKQLESQPKWKVWAELQIGDIELHQGQLSQAAITFRRVLAAQPDSSPAHFGLGISLLFLRNTQDALPELAVASRNPWLFAHPESLIATDAERREIKIQGFEEAKSGSALVDAFLKAVRQSVIGKDAGSNAAFNETFQAACKRRHEANEAHLRHALSGHATPEKLISLASEFVTEGDNPSASDALSHLSTKSDSASHLIIRARILAAHGEALGTAATLLALFKSRANQSPETDWWVSTLFLKVAELSLNQVLNIAPNSVDAHLLQAQTDDAHHRTEAAIRQFRLAVAAAPKDPAVHFRLGEGLWRAGRFQEAISALKAGIQLDPHNAAAYYQIGDSYFSLAEPAQALPFLSAALKQDPGLDAAYKDLGSIYLNQNQFQRAAGLLEKVTAHDQDGSVHYLLFRAYSRLGQKTRAAACLQQFKKLKAAAQDREILNAELAGAEKAKGQPLPQSPSSQ